MGTLNQDSGWFVGVGSECEAGVAGFEHLASGLSPYILYPGGRILIRPCL